MAKIAASVGNAGVNREDDVRTVQTLINLNIESLSPLEKVETSGTCDPDTIAAIREFQKRVLKVASPDGRVDPDGKTLAKLAEAEPATDIALDGVQLAAPAEQVLKEILRNAGLTSAEVTSGVRSAAEQARVMYENIVAKGVDFNHTLYASAGDQVIDVYAANQSQSKDMVIALMLAKINALGPSNVSKHCSDTHYVFDVAPSSIANKSAFSAAVKAHPAVSRLLEPPVDPAFHIEIPKDSPHL